jgi:hypothetical protein
MPAASDSTASHTRLDVLASGTTNSANMPSRNGSRSAIGFGHGRAA